jgi:hypothetical protein
VVEELAPRPNKITDPTVIELWCSRFHHRIRNGASVGTNLHLSSDSVRDDREEEVGARALKNRASLVRDVGLRKGDGRGYSGSGRRRDETRGDAVARVHGARTAVEVTRIEGGVEARMCAARIRECGRMPKPS